MCTLPNMQPHDLKEILEHEKNNNKKAKAEAVELLIAENRQLLLANAHWHANFALIALSKVVYVYAWR